MQFAECIVAATVAATVTVQLFRTTYVRNYYDNPAIIIVILIDFAGIKVASGEVCLF